VSETLQLGTSAAQAAVPHVATQASTHPTGNDGVAVSVQRVNEKIAAGRNDWRIQEWAGQALKKAGDPSSVMGRAQAILDAMRKQTVYAQDPPGTEMVKTAVKTLCLEGDRGVCLRVGDCDDLVVTFCSACMSIGIPCKTIIQAFSGNKTFTHIIAAVYDEVADRWYKVDPASKKPVGQVFSSTKEKEFDPMDQSTVALSGLGDYVGVGAVPSEQRVGLGASIVDDAEQAVALRIGNAVASLRSSAMALFEAANAARDSRADASGAVHFDPDPTPVISDLSMFPVNGTWTLGMDQTVDQILGIAWQMVAWGDDAMSGARQVYLSTQTAEAQIAAHPEDAYSIATLLASATNVLLGVVVAGAVTVGILTKDGTSLTPAQVQATVSSGTLNGVPVGLSGPELVPIVVGGLATVAVSVAAYYAISKLCDMATSYANAGVLTSALDCTVAGNNCTPEQKALLLESVTKATQAQAALEAAKHIGSTDWSTVAKWGAVAAVAVGAAVILGPIVRDITEAKSDARRTKSAAIRSAVGA
jgi:hypothetical protein